MRSRILTVALSVLATVLVAGGATAATRYVITSTHQITPSVLHQLKGKRGPRGYTGLQGSSGIAQITEVRSPMLTIPDGDSSVDVGGQNWEATCPPGYQVIGTGFDDGGIGQVGFVESFGTFVGGIVFNSNGVGVSDTGVELEAICAKLAGANAASAARSASQARYHVELRRTLRAKQRG